MHRSKGLEFPPSPGVMKRLGGGHGWGTAGQRGTAVGMIGRRIGASVGQGHQHVVDRVVGHVIYFGVDLVVLISSSSKMEKDLGNLPQIGNGPK